MRKMKKGLAIAAGILAIFAVLGAVGGLISDISLYSRPGVTMPMGEKIRVYSLGVVNIVLPLLLAVCCFRRKLGIFPGVVMGLHGLRALYLAVTGLLSGFTIIKVGYAYKAVGYFCGGAANLLRIALFVLLFLLCISKKEKKNGLAVFGFIPVALLAAVATFFSGLRYASSFSDAVSYVMTMDGAIAIAFGFIFSIIGEVVFLLAAAAINGAKENETDPYAQQMAQFQAAQYQQAQAQYQVPQYQPQYQQPQYQQPQYQQPQYQQPQYQAPQYQQPQYQAPQYQQPQYQAPQYQQPQYQAPQYQQPQYQYPQYQQPQYQAPQQPQEAPQEVPQPEVAQDAASMDL